MNSSERIDVPRHLLSSSGTADHYVLRVVGDNMISENILDGDFVIILRREIAEPGELVVVTVGDDSTIKRYYPEPDNMVRLQPSNPALESIFIPRQDIRVQGIVVGLMRRF